MSSSLRRGALAAAAIAVSVLSLAACGAGNNAQTLEVRPDHAATSVGDIEIQNAIVITQADLQSTGPAVVAATFFNSGRTDQTLESIKVDGTGKTAELSPAEGDGELTVPAGGRLILGGEGNASAVLPSSREAIQDGNAQKITFTFSKTGDVSLQAFVHPAESFYESWGPSGTPAAGATAGSSSQESAPGDGATGEPADGSSGSDAGSEPGTPADGASEGGTATAGAGEHGSDGH
ncbi:copper chaperone PCu(A)C [Streptomyces poriticola]|uniref:DUF461 domain-containing protein n=1 Tax=Streptomyces poriticola TaxID=3120506 RepID=UPI002FCE09DF